MKFILYSKMSFNNYITVSIYDKHCNVIRRVKMDVNISYNNARWLMKFGMIETLEIIGTLK